MASSRTNPFTAKSVGKPDTGSRAKAKAAADRSEQQVDLAALPDGWPRGINGQPMMRILMTAAELIPTGQYANVSVGPAQITAFVDQDRQLAEGESYFDDQQKSTIAQALNELAEIVEGDVIAVQRNLVMESMQDQVSKS